MNTLLSVSRRSRRSCCSSHLGRRALHFEPLEQRTLLSAGPYTLVKAADILADGGPPFEDVNLLTGSSAQGHTFNNNVTTNTPLTGGEVVTVGSNLLDQYAYMGGTSDDALYDGQPIVAVYALRGLTTVDVNGVSTFTVDPTVANQGGRLGFFVLPEGITYNRFDPLTWGATSADGTTLLTPIAVWDIKPAEDVVDPGNNPGAANTLADPLGGGEGIFNLIAANGQVNQISLNVAVAQNSQGDFLFDETTTFTGGTLEGNDYVSISALLDPNSPDPNNPANGNPVPQRFYLTDEGLVVRTDESAVASPNTTFVSQADRIQALNTIADDLGDLPDLDGGTVAIEAFATGFGPNGPTNYNPGELGTTADIQTTLGSTGSPTAQFASTASIHGIKFEDVDGDGVQDAGETGLPDWRIFLDGYDGNPQDGLLQWTDTVVVNGVWDFGEGEQWVDTDATGAYAFVNLLPDTLENPVTYHVREVVKPGWEQTTPNPLDITPASGDEYVWQEGAAGLNQDDDPLNPDNYFQEVLQEDLAIGNQQPCLIQGWKWHDLDADGVWDPCEKGLDGWTIFLDGYDGNPEDGLLQWTDAGALNGVWDPGEGEAWVLTGPENGFDGCCPDRRSGFYCFTGVELVEGETYTIAELLPTGWFQSYPGGPDFTHTITWTNTPIVGDYGVAEPPNFGNYMQGYVVGYKWCDANGNGRWDKCERGRNGVTIYFDDDNDGVRDPDEAWAITMTNPDSGDCGKKKDGWYKLPVTPGNVVIREVIPVGMEQTFPLDTNFDPTGHPVIVKSGETVKGKYGVTGLLNFGNQPLDSDGSCGTPKCGCGSIDCCAGKSTHDKSQPVDEDLGNGENVAASTVVPASSADTVAANTSAPVVSQTDTVTAVAEVTAPVTTQNEPAAVVESTVADTTPSTSDPDVAVAMTQAVTTEDTKGLPEEAAATAAAQTATQQTTSLAQVGALADHVFRDGAYWIWQQEHLLGKVVQQLASHFGARQVDEIDAWFSNAGSMQPTRLTGKANASPVVDKALAGLGALGDDSRAVSMSVGEQNESDQDVTPRATRDWHHLARTTAATRSRSRMGRAPVGSWR